MLDVLFIYFFIQGTLSFDRYTMYDLRYAVYPFADIATKKWYAI